MLKCLLAPMPLEEFTGKHWRHAPMLLKKPLRTALGRLRHPPVHSLIPLPADWNILRTPLTRLVKTEGGGPIDTPLSSVPDLKAAYATGHTVYLKKIHTHPFYRFFAQFMHSLQTELSPTSMWADIFLTPPNAQGFPAHFDKNESFVFQLSGTKTWQLFEPNPGYEFGKALDPSTLGSSTEYVTEAGDTLYIPYGWPHLALTTRDTPSTHLTLALKWEKARTGTLATIK